MSLGTWLSERAEDVAGVADDAWDATTEVASDAWNATTDAASEAWDVTTDAADAAWDATTEAAGDAWDTAVDIARMPAEAYGGVVRWVVNLVDLRDAAGNFDKAAADFMEIKSRLVPIPSSGLPPQLEGMVGGEVRAIGNQLEAYAEFLRWAADDLRARADTLDKGMLSSWTTPWSFQSGGQKAFTVFEVATTIIPVGLIAKGAVYGGRVLVNGVRAVKTFRALGRLDRLAGLVRTLERLGPPGRFLKGLWLRKYEKVIRQITKAQMDALPNLTMSAKQLQKKFKHAKRFGITAQYSPANGQLFARALRKHLDGALRFPGTYRGKPVIHNLDTASNLNVIQSPTGEFISGWRLGPRQLVKLLETRSLS